MFSLLSLSVECFFFFLYRYFFITINLLCTLIFYNQLVIILTKKN